MDHLVWTLFVSDGGMTCREIRKLWILQTAPDDVLDRKVSVAQSERGLERLLAIWKSMTCKVYPIILAQFFNNPRSASARFLHLCA